MPLKPRQISGNLPISTISKDYNRYCDRIVGNTIPGGSPPVAPEFAGLVSASGLSSQVALVWVAATSVDLPITYNIYWATSSGAQDFNTPNDTSLSGTGDTVTGLVNGTEYFFVVRAESSEGAEDTNVIEKTATPIVADLPQVVWDPLNKDAAISLSNSDRDATSGSGGWKSVRSLTGIANTETDKFYFELHQPDTTGTFQGGIGFADETESMSSFVGATTAGAMFTPLDGTVYTGGASGDFIGAALGATDVMCGVFDPVTREVWFAMDAYPDTSAPSNATLSGTGTVYLASSFNAAVTSRLSAVPRQWYWRDTILPEAASVAGPVPTISQKTLVFGDSISLSFRAPTLTDGLAHLVQEATSDSSFSVVSAINGLTAVLGDTDYTTMVTPYYDAGLETTLLTWLGTNDIFGAVGQVSAVETALASIVSKAKAEGWEHQFQGNITQRGTVAHAGTLQDWRDDADDINAWITANATDYTEILYRETNDDYRWETAPFSGNGPNPPYFDDVHPNYLGYQDFIPALETALQV